jgi:zinc protease
VAPSAAPTVPPIEFTQRTLKNGLKVIAIRDTSTPNVMVSMWYEVGSKHDPAGRSGFAHLFEHILSRKTVNMPYNEINRMVDDIGGTRNASTWYDRTNYYEIVPAEYLERMLWTHAERMARPVVDKEVFETERGVVKEELRQRVLAPPYGRLFNFAVGENVYNRLPHRRPTIGSIADLDSATLEDARAFHQAYYGPDTATLIVSGNFKPAELDTLVDKYFASIRRRARPVPLAIATKDTPIKARTVTATGPNVPLPVVGSAYQTPAASHPDNAALEVLQTLLAGGEHNRLDSALVKTGLATEVETDFNQTEEQGYFGVYGYVAGGKDPKAVAAEMDSALARLRTAPPTADELSEAKNELLSDTLSGRETFSSRAFELGEAYVRTGDPRSADKRLQNIAKVTAADVQRVARTYLNPARRLELRYVKGDGDPKQWANPRPLPKFRTVPPATGPGNALRPEAEREKPPAPGERVAFVAPKFTDARLANGVRFIAARTGEVPLATMTVLIDAGSAVDPRSKAGLANLVASIADKGTPTRDAEAIAAGLEQLGASLSAQANSDGTYISLTAPEATLGAASEILADIVRNASFPDEDFTRERKRALDALSVATKEPGQLAAMLVNPVVYGTAPYGNIAGGTEATLAGLTRADLLNFRQTWWRPETTTVLVSGGIDPDKARAIADRAFGAWQVSGTAPARPANLAGNALAGRTLVIDLPGSGQAAVYAAARGLSRADRAYYDALIANAVLGGSTTSRLFEEIRVKRALSYGASSSLAAQKGGGALIAAAQTKNESAAEVAKIFLDQFARVAAEPLSPKEVENRKTLLTGSFQRQVQTSAGFNGTLAGGVLRGLDPTEVIAYPERVASVSGSAATAAMAQLLKPEAISLVIVGDSAKFVDKLRALRPNVEVVPADQLDLSTASARR